MRDAVVAAMTLNIFNNRCDVVAMANVAQLCNNLHSLYLAHGEDFVETPNYHVFDMYKGHQGARQLQTVAHCVLLEREGYAPLECLSASASEKDGHVTLTMANLNADAPLEVKLTFVGGDCGGDAEITTLTHEDLHACNTFENPHTVEPVRETRPLRCGDCITLPAGSVVSVRI